MKKLNRIALSLMLVSFAFTGCSANTSDKDKNKEKTQEGVEIDGSVISWANMKADDKNLKLTDQQKEIVKYYDVDYLKIKNYENLQRYPDVFKGSQVKFYGYVKKVIKSNDENYQLLFQLNSISDGNPEDETEKNYVVIEGKQQEPRIVENDDLLVFGRYKEIKEYDIDGKKESLPTISVNNTCPITFSYQDNLTGDINRYDEASITKVAKAIFGEGSRTSFNDDLNDNKFNCSIPKYAHEAYYNLEPGNTLSGNPKFLIGLVYPNILFADSTQNYTKELHITPDFENYIATSYDTDSKKLYLDYYDKEFNKKWSKDFTDIKSFSFDYTMNSIYLNVNNDLHILNTNDGKNIIDPTMVGKKVKITIVDDGAILIGEGATDNVIKVDTKGQIKWKTSIDLDVTKCEMLQIIDKNIIISVNNINEESFLEVPYYTSVIAEIDQSGKIKQSFTDEGGAS